MYPIIEIKKNEINTKKDIDCAIPKKKNNENDNIFANLGNKLSNILLMAIRL